MSSISVPVAPCSTDWVNVSVPGELPGRSVPAIIVGASTVPVPRSKPPPATIKSGETASFCAEGTPGSTGGTQGSVTYKIGETETMVTMNFAVDENQISHSQSAAFTTNGFRANIAGAEDCARSWRGTPHCFCNYTFTIKVNR